MKIFSFILCAVFFSSQAAYSLPLPRGNPERMEFPPNFNSNYDFEGIVKLDNCSGSLIQLEGAPDSDPALILTNGHCLEHGFPAPGAFVYKQSSSRTFRLLSRDAEKLGVLHATEILYATMTQTDMAIYRLQETYDYIKATYGIRPLTLSSQHPEAGMEIDVISGYWKRGYSCSVHSFVHSLHEADYVWSDSIRYTEPGCEVIGGTSGSPVILRGSRMVIGVNNTTNEDGYECTMNNPCEVDEAGNIGFGRGRSYAQETLWVYSCLNFTGNDIDLMNPGCLLPRY